MKAKGILCIYRWLAPGYRCLPSGKGGSCVFTDDLHLDTDVFHLEKGNFEIFNSSHWFQGYSPVGSDGRGGRTLIREDVGLVGGIQHVSELQKARSALRWPPLTTLRFSSESSRTTTSRGRLYLTQLPGMWRIITSSPQLPKSKRSRDHPISNMPGLAHEEDVQPRAPNRWRPPVWLHHVETLSYKSTQVTKYQENYPAVLELLCTMFLILSVWGQLK